MPFVGCCALVYFWTLRFSRIGDFWTLRLGFFGNLDLRIIIQKRSAMNNDLKKILNSDTDGLLTYEYIANHMGSCDEDMPVLTDNIIRVDMTGQITVSAALYLHATGAEKYREIIDKLIAASLSKDREHKYIVDLLSGIWGEDYKSHAEELKQESDNFRRIYKRVYVNDII